MIFESIFLASFGGEQTFFFSGVSMFAFVGTCCEKDEHVVNNVVI